MDDDGASYLIFEDRPLGFRIVKLSDDYLNVERQMCLIPEHLEGGALVHYDRLYLGRCAAGQPVLDGGAFEVQFVSFLAIRRGGLRVVHSCPCWLTHSHFGSS